MFKIILISTLLAVVSAQTRFWNLDGCRNQAQLTANGRVVKNVCELTQQLNYDQAQAACAAQGMQLFFAEDNNVFSSFQTYIKNSFGSNTTCGESWVNACGLWISGKLVSNAWQKTVNPITWFDPPPTWYPMAIWADQRIPGNCKVVKRLSGGVGTNNWDCTKLFSPICEYNNTYTAPVNCTTSNQGKRYFNLNACKSIETLRDSCGNVVKGVCELNSGPLTYDKAIQACSNAGMDLVVAETNAIFKGLTNFVNKNYFDSPCGNIWNSTCGLWIGGRRASQAFNDYVQVKDSAIVKLSIQDSNVNYLKGTGDNPGNCLALKKVLDFISMDYNCNSAFVPICEFDSRV